MLHITFYGGRPWVGLGSWMRGKIVVVEKTHPILSGSFWSRPDTSPSLYSFSPAPFFFWFYVYCARALVPMLRITSWGKVVWRIGDGGL